ncbi:MAG: preprotein translocase subunit SecA, partial [Sphingobacteriia bacterium]|nr:preprotein translocase subunit SecA [Sphingobacteriia bacterium]
MGFNEFMSKLFGNKAQRDLKELMPILEKIKAAYPQIEQLDNDGLRGQTIAIKAKIADTVQADKDRIAELRAGIETMDIDEREKIYTEIDKLEKTIDEKLEKVLDEVLPEVFSIVKETARRFAENETITVTATEFDRKLSTKFDFVHIDGDKAIFSNEWMAGGNMVKWDMVHYDVQLIGGIV